MRSEGKNAGKVIVGYENVKFMDVLCGFSICFTGIDLLDCLVSLLSMWFRSVNGCLADVSLVSLCVLCCFYA